MNAKDLFTIILKVFGIYMLKDVLVSIMPVIESTFKFFQVSPDIAVFSLVVSLLIFAVYFGIVYLLLFKTNWLILKLQLTSDLSTEPLHVNLHRSSVYTIAVIVSGIVILVFSIPQLVRNLYNWYQFIDSGRSGFGNVHFDFSRILESLAEVIIGFLFLGNSRTIVNFIEVRRRDSKTNNELQ